MWTVSASTSKSRLHRRDPARTLDVATEDPTSPNSAPQPASRETDVATGPRGAFDKASLETRLPVPGVEWTSSSPPSTLSVGYADTPCGFPPRMPVFSGEAREPPSCRKRVPGLVGFGWTFLPDVAAVEWSPPIRLPRKLWLSRDDPEPWTMSPKRYRSLRQTHATNDLHASGPERPAVRRSMWFDDRAAQRNSRRSAPPPCCHGRGMPRMLNASFWNRTPLDPSPDEPFGLTELWSSRHPAATAEATTNQHSTNRRPDNRSPTEHLAGDTSATARASPHETLHSKQPCTGPAVTSELPQRP